MINMNNLSTLTITALIMAISFTVLAVAGVFYTVYRKGSLNNPVGRVICLFALPFTAFAMWALAGLSMSNVFANNEALAIFLSILISFALLTIIYFVAKFIVDEKKKKQECDKKDVEANIANVEEDLNNLKKIIDDVIEEPKKEAKEEKIEEVKETKTEEVKETKTEEVKQPEVVVEKIVIEKKQRKPRAKKEATNKTQEIKAEEPKQEVKEEPKQEVIKITKTVRKSKKAQEVKPEEIKEVKPEEVKTESAEDEESDFIKSLSKILEELENDNKDGE